VFSRETFNDRMFLTTSLMSAAAIVFATEPRRLQHTTGAYGDTITQELPADGSALFRVRTACPH
jgi:hypothetical protein